MRRQGRSQLSAGRSPPRWNTCFITKSGPTSSPLSSIAINGAASVNESTTSPYTATATWSDGTTTNVTSSATWTTNQGTISASGVLTAPSVTANQTATVTASYTSGGVTRTATRSVTIVNVSATTPAAAKNIGITGPISSGTTMLWRLAWDAVTTYENGAPLESGRTVRYTAYWTDDPALSPASLRILASSIPATMVEFDPLAYPMVGNQVIYLTVQCVLDTGDPSSLAASIAWVVANTGPAPPTGGMIIKK